MFLRIFAVDRIKSVSLLILYFNRMSVEMIVIILSVRVNNVSVVFLLRLDQLLEALVVFFVSHTAHSFEVLSGSTPSDVVPGTF